MNINLNRMATWFKANKLAVNISKTKYIIFRVKGKNIPLDLPQIVYNKNDTGLPVDPGLVTPLERIHNGHEKKECRYYKLLGIHLDEHLTFDSHVTHLTQKLTKSMYCIRMAKNNLNSKGLRALYFALIHSHLSYCPVILNCLSSTNKSKIFKIQKKAIRTITNSRYNDHTSPLFIQHKILPFEKILKLSNLKFMHSIVYNYAPKSFNTIWTRNNERQRNHNLRDQNLFSLPVPRIELFKKFPIYSLPHTWNNCGALMFYDNKFTFLHALRDHLFTELENELNN
jgi:hypothetical protein